jgi:hypothetical protein
MTEFSRRSMFAGQEMRRVGSLLFMLVLIGLAIWRFSDPNAWTWLVPGPGAGNPAVAAAAAPGSEAGKPAAAEPAAAKPPAGKPAAKRPAAKKTKLPAAGKTGKTLPAPPAPEPEIVGTDLDWEEAEAISEEREVITDGTLYIQNIEMNAYQRVLKWVLNQPWDLLEKRAKKQWGKRIPTYDHFNSDPEKRRFQLVELDLDVRSVRPVDKVKGIDQPLSEVWGITAESGDHLYDVVVVDRPAAMPTGDVFEGAKVVGYFFKMQGYVPRGGGPRLTAPFLIGRIQWQPASTLPTMQASDWKWGVGAVAVVLVIAVALGFATMRGKGLRGGAALGRSPNTPALEAWLAGQDDAGETLSGNNFTASGDSNNGESNQEDPRHGVPPVSPA